MVHASHPERGRCRALAPAALLLALCLLAGGAQAVTGPTNMAALVTGEGEIHRGAISNGADGEPFPVPADPAHVWVAGDVFSLHGVDRYRYVVVYTRDTDDGRVHGCYEVDRTDSGSYEVSQYVHGQEVFGDAFIAEQGGRFIENVPLGEVAITDDTPGNDGQSYFGLTLGSIFGAANAPVPTATPEPVPTAAHWPSLAPTQAPLKPTAAPTGVVSVTRTPGPDPTVPDNAQPFPMPTVSTTPVLPVETVTTAPDLAPPPGPAVTIRAATVTPVVTAAPASPGSAPGKRYAVGNPGSFLGTTFGSGGASTGAGSAGAAVAPAVTERPGSRAFGIAPPTGRFVRWYPAARWAAGIP